MLVLKRYKNLVSAGDAGFHKNFFRFWNSNTENFENKIEIVQSLEEPGLIKLIINEMRDWNRNSQRQKTNSMLSGTLSTNWLQNLLLELKN